MKRIYRYTFFVFILMVIIISIDLFSFTKIGNIVMGKVCFCTGYQKIGTTEIIPRIDKVQENKKYTKLIVGDSVSNQMFWELQAYNEEYCIATSNGGITIPGEYILIRLFLENHQDVTDVYLVHLPTTLVSGFESKLSYDYLVAPMSITDKLSYLDTTSITELQNIYGKIFLGKNVVKFINYSPINSKLFLNYSQKKLLNLDNSKLISDEAILYLYKIDELCLQYGVKLHFLSGPMPDDAVTKEKVEKIKKYAESNSELSFIDDYFDSIIYCDSNMFSDGVHFGGAYKKQEIYNEEIKKIAKNTELISNLKFE